MGARIIPFFEKVTETFSYLVMDPPTQAAAIIDPVLDYALRRCHRSSGFWNCRREPGSSCATTMPRAAAPTPSRRPSPKSGRKTSISMPASPKTPTRRGFFCRRCSSICAPANCRPPESNGRRHFNSMIPGDPLAIIWVRSTGKRSRARSPSWYDRFRLDVAAGSGQVRLLHFGAA